MTFSVEVLPGDESPGTGLFRPGDVVTIFNDGRAIYRGVYSDARDES